MKRKFKKTNIEIYTDGSCTGKWIKSNTTGMSYGSYAFVILEEGKELFSYSRFEKNTTNNRMEILGVLDSLNYLKENEVDERVTIYSDSKYVLNSCKEWIYKWERNDWIKSDGMGGKEEVKNKDLWVELFPLLNHFDINFIWVKGHNGNEWNEYVDNLCTQEINKQGLKSFEQINKKALS